MRAVYSLTDSLMQHDLLQSQKPQETEKAQWTQMERELKAIIQQYMERMTENRLIPGK